jgi:protein-disulfide isomerase
MEEQNIPTEIIEPGNKPARPVWILWLALGSVLLLLCAAGFIGALIMAGPQFLNKYLPDSKPPVQALPRLIIQSNTMGNPNAPVHIIEYGDFQCPYCLKFWHETEPQLIKEYVNTGDVFFEYRTYAILGPESTLAAEGAYCAGDQNKFWEYHDTLFSNWTGENVGDFTKEKLIGYAKSIQLEMGSFQECLNTEKHKKTIENERVQAGIDEVTSTPTFIINGEKVEGSQSFEVMKHIIQEILDGGLNTGSG